MNIPNESSLKACRICGRPLTADVVLPKNKGAICRVCDGEYSRRRMRRKLDIDPEARRRVCEYRLAQTRRAEARLRAAATNRGRPWSPAEDDVLLRRELSHREAAALIGRTAAAVVQQRLKLSRRLGLPEPIRAFAKTPRKYFPRAVKGGDQ